MQRIQDEYDTPEDSLQHIAQRVFLSKKEKNKEIVEKNETEQDRKTKTTKT